MGTVILDIQHAGKPTKRDLGASHDIDGDGVVELWEHEAKLTPIYAEAAVRELEAAGHTVVMETSGSYSSRHKRAVKLAEKSWDPVAYVACHLNAGGGDYGLVCWDYRSRGGKRLSRLVGAELQLEFNRDELRRVIVPDNSATAPSVAPDDQAARRQWSELPRYDGSVLWPRAWGTIKGIYRGPEMLSGICFEPAFLDTHADLINTTRGLERIGGALAIRFFI